MRRSPLNFYDKLKVLKTYAKAAQRMLPGDRHIEKYNYVTGLFCQTYNEPETAELRALVESVFYDLYIEEIRLGVRKPLDNEARK